MQRAEREARIDAALAADPALADELEMILSAFDPHARERFEAAFSEEVERHERPAAAVLAALSRAGRPSGEGAPEG